MLVIMRHCFPSLTSGADDQWFISSDSFYRWGCHGDASPTPPILWPIYIAHEFTWMMAWTKIGSSVFVGWMSFSLIPQQKVIVNGILKHGWRVARKRDFVRRLPGIFAALAYGIRSAFIFWFCSVWTRSLDQRRLSVRCKSTKTNGAFIPLVI